MQSKLKCFTAAMVAAAVSMSSTAASAQSTASLTSSLAAACGAMAQGGAIRPGCVLPAIDTPAPAPVANAGPIRVLPPPRAGLGIPLPLILGLAALIGALLIFHKGNHNGNDDDSLSNG